MDVAVIGGQRRSARGAPPADLAIRFRSSARAKARRTAGRLNGVPRTLSMRTTPWYEVPSASLTPRPASPAVDPPGRLTGIASTSRRRSASKVRSARRMIGTSISSTANLPRK